MAAVDMSDQSPHWFIFLIFTNGVGWRWGSWQWLTPFQAVTASTTAAPGASDLRIYWWDGSSVTEAFDG